MTIQSVETYSGKIVNPPASGVTAVVGPNNSGKSTFLREIREILGLDVGVSVPDWKAIKNVAIDKRGSVEDLYAFLLEEVTSYVRAHNQKGFAISSNSILLPLLAEKAWKNFANDEVAASLGTLSALLVHDGNPFDRLNWIQPREQRKNIEDPANHPLLKLQDRPDLLTQVQEISQQIFRQTLTLDRLSREVQLRVGTPEIESPPVDAVTSEYRDALIKLGRLQDQGDGMKSVLGLLLPLICGSFPILIVDEPEAFLHPPQARLVGKILGEISRTRPCQLFLATHDRNLLVGLLESQASVSIIRLERVDADARSFPLEYQRVQDLWNDAVFRYSNVLDGLFHRAVVLAEGDRDCRFYAASLDGYSQFHQPTFPLSDVLFVPAGGKDGLPRLVKALSAVSVPVVVVADLDLLNDSGKTKILVEAMQGDWKSIEPDYKLATEQFRQTRGPLTKAQVLHLIKPLLENESDALFTGDTQAAVKAALRTVPNPWNKLKETGQRAFRGQAADAAARLLDALENLGIVLVRDGELECLAPTVQSSKGPNWLREALERNAHLDEPAQKHILRVVTAIESRLSLTYAEPNSQVAPSSRQDYKAVPKLPENQLAPQQIVKARAPGGLRFLRRTRPRF